MVTYAYSVTSGFPTGPNISALNADIIANIATTHVSTDVYGDSISINFSGTLSANEQLILTNLVAQHDNTPVLGNRQLDYSINVFDIDKTTYTQTLTMLYPGTIIQNITHVRFTGNMNIGGTSYTVRLFDVNNNIVICEDTFTNTTTQINDLTITGTLPESLTILEFHCKVTGNTKANIRSLIMYYDK